MFPFSKKSTPKFPYTKDISQLKSNHHIEDIFILGNGPSLNNYLPEELSSAFTIGTNRSWLWGDTNILIWRDERITEELDFFKIQKTDTIRVAGEPSLAGKMIQISKETINSIDYNFEDKWKDSILGKGIKWNGIIFHAIALALHISPNAKLHLIGVDLGIQSDIYHFFNEYNGFNKGFYKNNWDNSSFNYKKRLDMMFKNFELLKSRNIKFINHSKNSRLTDLFGYSSL